MVLDNLFRNSKVDALVILSESNRYYFTGLNTSAGCVILTPNSKTFITDFRYETAAREALTDFEIVIAGKADFLTEIASRTVGRGIKSVGFEGGITYDRYKQLKTALHGATLKDAQAAIAAVRMIKTPDEIADISKAQEIAQSALTKTLKSVRSGVSERDIYADLVYNMLSLGAEAEAFPAIVAIGENAAKPHHHPSDRELEKGEMLMIDFGAKYKGYCSDMTRTFAFGTPPKANIKMYEDVLAAQNYALKNIRAGITGHEADSFAREFLLSRGFGAEFGHSTGHGIGVDIHELPSLAVGCDIVLQENMVVSVEPGVYISGVGGVRIEDLVVITNDGVRNLTTFTKDMYL